MKTIYKLLVLGIVYLVSNITQAQIVQYSEDGTKSCIDCEEKTSTDSDCFCYFFEDVPRFHEVLAKIEAEKREEWLRGKEKILKDVIEDRLSTTYTSYTEAQRAFLKAYSAESYSKSILDDLENNISATQRPKEIEKDKNYYEIRTIEKLFEYNNEGTAHKFGDLKMNGKYLKDIPNQDAVVIHTGLDNKKKEIANQLAGISRILQGIPKIRQNKALEERIINDFMNHYNGHDFLNRVLLMAKYLIWQNNGHVVGNNPANDPYPPTVFNPNAYDYPGVARDLALNAGQSASVSYPQVTDDQAIASYAISTFGDNEFGFVTANPDLLNEARSYLIYNKYSKDGLDLADDLFSSYVNNTNFPHNKYNYSQDTGMISSVGYQDAQNPNRLFRVGNFNADQLHKFYGLGNMLSDLSKLSNIDKGYVGQFFIEILKDQGYDLSVAFNAEQAFDLFHFTDFGYSPLVRQEIRADFNYNIGQTLWDNGLSFLGILNDPFKIEGILALANGGAVDFNDGVILDSSFLKTNAYCVYSELKKRNGNLFRTTIGSFIDDPKYKLYFRVGECKYTDEACTDGDDTVNGVITIKIENTNMQSLNAAAMLLHEGIHAEMFRFVNEAHNSEVNPNDRKRLVELYRLYAELGVDNPPTEAQHTYMAENYVKPIARAIRTLDNNKYPLEYYMGYGWEGLKNNAHPTLLTNDEFNEFLRLKRIVEDNTDFNPINCN